MPFAPLSGHLATITYDAGSRPAINWTLSPTGNHADASNFRDGRKPMVTLEDADLTWTEIVDTDAPPFAIKPGDTAAASLVVGVGETPDAITCNVMIVSTVLTNPGVNGPVTYAVTAKLDGTITYPS